MSHTEYMRRYMAEQRERQQVAISRRGTCSVKGCDHPAGFARQRYMQPERGGIPTLAVVEYCETHYDRACVLFKDAA